MTPSMAKAPNVDVVAEATAASKALAPAVRRLAKALARLEPKQLPLGAATDLLYALRGTKALVATVAAPFDDVLSPAMKTLEEHFINTLAVGEASGVQGHTARVQVTDSVVPTVRAEDWPKFFAWVAKTRQWEFLAHSVNKDAVRERWEAKKSVPHVTPFHAKKVSCTKLGGKK